MLTSGHAPPTSKANAMTPSHLVSDEDRAIELATRPRRGVPLTADEKRVRRRLQYKLHQRRHRAKQRATTEQLELDIGQLNQDIEVLEHRLQKACLQQDVFSARGTNAGAPVRVVMEYVRHFEHGFDREAVQEPFLRSMMVPHVIGPDYEGIDAMLHQWRLYHAFFPHTQLASNGVEVTTTDDLTVVVLDIVLTLRGRRDGILALYPGLHHDEQLIQTFVGSAVPIPGKLRFVFRADGKCTWMGSEVDFVAALQRTFGSLKAVAKCLDGANMSFATGRIAVDYYSDSETDETRLQSGHVIDIDDGSSECIDTLVSVAL